ncbi:indolepyruvate ferredoxin oxidoreductase [Pseudomonas aeruginosa]|uniref:indolepyruvate ferredoxin oxidoreductase family protein n=1 Tax=Pseudomonadaceae TaxID=135621 RepID=UPI000A10B829|nr:MULTISPECIES: indolepyruvate ferredoxin oxidoreductase family protein [Pseudomonadaceae]ORL55145.1 indolepyruvate ferredoxin oxidoreductase [Pseudomonas aeruginosa]
MKPSPIVQEVLPDRYGAGADHALLSGTQALARLPLEQRWRDRAAGLNTAGYISGYRGSPLATYDMELLRIREKLQAENVKFQPGVNEDLAATAVWGTQFVPLYPGARFDGVFGIWYGKSPGLDRSMDAFLHANTAGTSEHGGVVALVGDDHASKSSSRSAQSDLQLKAAGLPILYPCSTQEILDYGLHAIAMSRYSGCWTSLKLVTDVVETTSVIDVRAERLQINLPPLPTQLPPAGLYIKRNEAPLEMEARLHEHRIPAALAYARANGLNRIHLQPANPRVGIVSAGKSWSDVRAALALLELDDSGAEAAGLRLLKLGLTWPVDPQIVAEFVEGLDTVLVVEEKRPFIEEQLRSILQALDLRVRVVGKAMPAGMGRAQEGQLPISGELSPQIVARSLALLAGVPLSAAAQVEPATAGPMRLPNFCSGCPHNTSTVVPEGSRAMPGIGCHGMAMWIRPETTGTVTHMGAEGMFWVGQSAFTEEPHVFVNIGDGTFFHSGSLALRQAVAAGVRVTYKVLYNGYVSMTGGQRHDGDVSVQKIIDIAQAEGVGRIVVVTSDLGRYADVKLPAGIALRHREELDAVQRELREFDGVSVLVYDQACATELRRLRKRKEAPEPDKRTFINPEVCEGCGDCGVKSNCMSVEPLETELGRKRQINQSSCNKDFSCVEGFCPSFVTVHGGRLKRPARSAGGDWGELAEPALPGLDGGYNLLLAGIGGTGIVTVGTILGQAAQLDGLATSLLDLTGLAQKYGAVMTHLRFARDAAEIPSSRLTVGEADAVVGCDLIVTAGQEALSKVAAPRSFVVVNTAVNPTGEFTKSADWDPHAQELLARLRERTEGALHALDANRLATALMGDAIAINMFLVGFAWQHGRIPVTLDALRRAIELNGVSVEFNLQSFEWGRRAAVDLAAVEAAAAQASDVQVIQFPPRAPQTAQEIVENRSQRLTDYQNSAYAQRYRDLVAQVQSKDEALGAAGRLASAAARYYYKLLADKDEFEVARLYSSETFRQQLAAQFEGDYKLHFHLGAWPLGRRDAQGNWHKREVGPWMLSAMGLLKRLRWTRDSWLDPFRHTPERKLAKALLARYEDDLELILEAATPQTLEAAIELAELPEHIRGYGHVREAHARKVEGSRAALRSRLLGEDVSRQSA